MSYTYYGDYHDFVSDLSSNGIINTTSVPVYFGKDVLFSKDGSVLFVSTLKSTNNIHGDVFSYIFQNNAWTYAQSFFALSTVMNSHNDGSNSYSASFGDEIACSGDGSVLFVNAPTHRGPSGVSHGSISIFKKATTWTHVQEILEDAYKNNQIGYSICCNDDGTRLFIGSNVSNYSDSFVLLYTWDGTQYSKHSTFSNIKPTLTTGLISNFGESLSCDSSGTTVVIGSSKFYGDINGNTRYPGNVHIASENNNTWSIVKDCFVDISNNRPVTVAGTEMSNVSYIGRKVAIDRSGTHIFISTGLHGNTSQRGVVYYFENVSGTYTFKNTLFEHLGTTTSLYFGCDIAVTYDKCVITTDSYDAYVYDLSSTWIKSTQSISTTLSPHYTSNSVIDNFGSSVSLDESGKWMAVGAKNYRYNNPTSSISGIIGQVYVLRGKSPQQITMSNISGVYGTTQNLVSQTNGSGSPVYSNLYSSTIYSIASNKITFSDVGSTYLKVTYSSDLDYETSSKIVEVVSSKAGQTIEYNAAITTQGFIGIGQTSGITFESKHNSTSQPTGLTVTYSVSGNTITYDPINKTVEGISIGQSELILSQYGSTKYFGASTVYIQYDVQAIWSGSMPPGYSPTFEPKEEGLDLLPTSGLPEEPEIGTIVGKINEGVQYEDKGDYKIYSLPMGSYDTRNNLKRTKIERFPGQFHFMIQQMSDNIQYSSITIKDSDMLATYPIPVDQLETINALENKTDMIRIDKYVDEGGVYTKPVNDYTTIKVYFPHDSLVVYHVDELSGLTTEVNSDNFPDSAIVREYDGSPYWYVKMPFSIAIGGQVAQQPQVVNENIICFREGTLITCFCLETNREKHISVEELTKYTLIKTYKHGYVMLESLAYGFTEPYEKTKKHDNCLYKCSKTEYPDLFDDLYITGFHSILEDEITEAQREAMQSKMNGIFVTDDKYRLIVMTDPRATVYKPNEVFKVWHVCLQNTDPFMNYGIYANGLLVESCSKNSIETFVKLF